jgi:hypothetical protein
MMLKVLMIKAEAETFEKRELAKQVSREAEEKKEGMNSVVAI